ncbi:MAG: 6-phospho-beta-glucosidase [Paraclostridium sordellii]|uniref:6-phospho-beta-glucosidase n=2 Tax=Paraclostridium sordellii TaxID=1505 RepID=A0A0C7R4I7_PARSO|nr:6-phospho-beta-glucosidase [Paeniclostridium sordellii]CEQ04158.1 cellobiose-6-phosphate hydrolase [[Clostridium] sordellii] [Paeniclostridium sordellii]
MDAMEKGLKIVTIGGGSSYTPELIEGFIKRHKELPVRELWLVDIEDGKEKLDIVGNLARRMVEKSGIDLEIHTTLDRRKALVDADFVTTQLRVGLLDARIKDERIPLSHGIIGQETNGPGGFFKALRTVPVILDIIKDIEELCPNAWLINFTNPAGIITEMVFNHTNFKRFIGLCNVPIGVKAAVAEALDVDKEKIEVTFAGLNHMVYGLKVCLDGIDITEEAIEKFTHSEMSMRNIKSTAPFNPRFIKSLGAIPCPYHRYYYKTKDMLEHELKEFEKGQTRAEVVKALENDLFELYKDENLDIKPPQLEKRGGAYYSDAACNLINSIYNDKKDIQVVNTLNKGAIKNIGYNNAVEVSSVITKEGPMPLTIGEMPIGTVGLLNQIKSFEILTAKAAVLGDYDTSIQALSINPLVPSDELAEIIMNEMLIAHEEYLPQFKSKIAELKVGDLND